MSEVQENVQPQISLLVGYYKQLALFKKQRDDAKLQFDQLNGAIYATEQMIKQYEEMAKQSLPIGEDNNGKINQSKKKVASKK